MKKIILITILLLAITALAFAETIRLSWSPTPDTVGYRIYQSEDVGVSWTLIQESNATSISINSTALSGLTLWRVSSYNEQFEAFRSESGWWYHPGWVVPDAPVSMMME